VLILAVSLSVLGLAVGPLLLAWGRGRSLPSAALEGLTLGLVPAVVLLRLVPHVHEEVGPLAFALLAAGYGVVWIVERRRHRALGQVGQAVTLPALLVHATVDGATLGVALGRGQTQDGGMLLAAALLVHRVPEGLFIARALVPEIGWRRTGAWLAVLAGATVAGAALGDRVLTLAPHEVFHGIVAVGLGAILRLTTHTHDRAPQTRGGVWMFGAALVAGLVVSVMVPAASLRGPSDEAAHDPGAATLVGAAALVLVVGLGLLRFAPRSLRSLLGPSLDHDHDHAHTHGHSHDPARDDGARAVGSPPSS
jgi:zinc transporter ZupT